MDTKQAVRIALADMLAPKASHVHRRVIDLNADPVGSEARLAWRRKHDKKAVQRALDELVAAGEVEREVKTTARGTNGNLKGKTAVYAPVGLAATADEIERDRRWIGTPTEALGEAAAERSPAARDMEADWRYEPDFPAASVPADVPSSDVAVVIRTPDGDEVLAAPDPRDVETVPALVGAAEFAPDPSP